MSGFLRRLAGRALGTGIPIHSVAGLPFAEPLRAAEPDVVSPTAPLVGRGVAGPGQPTVAERSLSPRHAAESLEVVPRAPTMGPVDLTVRAETPLSALPPPEYAPLRSPQPPIAAEVPPLTASPPPVGEPQARAFVPLVPRAAPSRTLLRRSPGQRTGAQPPPAARSATSTRRREGAARTAEPTVPGVEVQRPVAEPDATEIHVHIGRIEVTAVPPTPAPKRAAPGTLRPMSLSAYLDQRNGKRR